MVASDEGALGCASVAQCTLRLVVLVLELLEVVKHAICRDDHPASVWGRKNGDLSPVSLDPGEPRCPPLVQRDLSGLAVIPFFEHGRRVARMRPDGDTRTVPRSGESALTCARPYGVPAPRYVSWRGLPSR
jgi:hypothetical protein